MAELENIPRVMATEVKGEAVPTVTATATPPKQTPDELLASEGMVVKQNMKDCCRDCAGCQPNFEWTVHAYSPTYAEAQAFPTVMFMQEDAPCMQRCWSFWSPGCRQTKFNVHYGENTTHSGSVLFTHSKPQTCGKDTIVLITDGGPIYCPMCCCLPFLETRDSSDKLLGQTKYHCDECLWVPKFKVQDGAGQDVYLIRSDTCCGGCCIQCVCSGTGGRCCAVPMHIRDPVTKEKIEDAEITWLWPGVKKACCDRNNYAIKFPKNATPEIRKTLMGAVLLIDITIFETNQQ